MKSTQSERTDVRVRKKQFITTLSMIGLQPKLDVLRTLIHDHDGQTCRRAAEGPAVKACRILEAITG